MIEFHFKKNEDVYVISTLLNVDIILLPTRAHVYTSYYIVYLEHVLVVINTIMFRAPLVLIVTLSNLKLQAVGITSSTNAVRDFACPECQCRWDEMEELVKQYMEADLVQLRLDEDVITPGQGRNLIYKFLVKTFCVCSLLKNKDHKEEYTGFQPVSKKFKHSSK